MADKKKRWFSLQKMRRIVWKFFDLSQLKENWFTIFADFVFYIQGRCVIHNFTSLPPLLLCKKDELRYKYFTPSIARLDGRCTDLQIMIFLQDCKLIVHKTMSEVLQSELKLIGWCIGNCYRYRSSIWCWRFAGISRCE